MCTLPWLLVHLARPGHLVHLARLGYLAAQCCLLRLEALDFPIVIVRPEEHNYCPKSCILPWLQQVPVHPGFLEAQCFQLAPGDLDCPVHYRQMPIWWIFQDANCHTVAPGEPCMPWIPCGPVLPIGPGGPGGPVIVANDIAWQEDTSKSDSDIKKQLNTTSANQSSHYFASLAEIVFEASDTLQAERPEQRPHILSRSAPHRNWLDHCRMLHFAIARPRLRRL